MALMRRKSKEEAVSDPSPLQRRKRTKPIEVPEEEVPFVRLCLERLWGGYLLDVPEDCPYKVYTDTNTRMDVLSVDAYKCKFSCPQSISKYCEAGKWLFKTAKTRIRIQREGS